jgi:uncharacterized membrane protein
MNKQIRWLHEQMRGWVMQGIVTQPQVEAIARLYPEPEAALPWGVIIFSGIGAGVIGLGVILLLAYNWDAIPKFAKLGLIFGFVIAAHMGGLWLFAKDDWRRPLGEALGVLGTMFFGAGIWLVAQIYHIEEHFPNGFLLWGVGALILAWVMPSVAQAAVAAVSLTIWGMTETVGFGAPTHGSPLLLAAGVGALAWHARSRFLLVVVLTGFDLLLISNAASSRAEVAFPTALNASILFVALGALTQRSASFPASAPILKCFGWAGFLVVTYILTFAGMAEDILKWHEHAVGQKLWVPLALYGWLPFALALAVWAWLVLAARRPSNEPPPSVEAYLLPLTAIVSQFLAVTLPTADRSALAGIFNLVFLAIAAMWMARGCREGELKPTILGSLLLVALVLARYFDLFDNLAARGAVFLVVGGVLFAEGFFYRRARQRLGERRTGP